MNETMLVTIGSDRALADKTSSVWKRTEVLACLCARIGIIVFALKTHATPKALSNGNVDVYFTCSKNRAMYLFDAYRIGKKIISQAVSRVIISTQDPFEAGLVGLMLAKKFGLSLHVQIHTDIGSSCFRSSLLNKIRLFIARIVINRAQGVRVVSARIRDYVVSRYKISPERITILPIWSDYTPEKRVQPQNPYILVVSRLEKEKRIEDAINAFARLAREEDAVRLTIAGSGREEENLRHLARVYNVEDRIEFLGHISDLGNLYAGASCLLHTASYEGFGLVLYEAMRSGCPIVTTNVGIAEDIKQKGCPVVICDVGDVEQLAVGLSSYIKNFHMGEEEKYDLSVPHTQNEYMNEYIKSLEKAL